MDLGANVRKLTLGALAISSFLLAGGATSAHAQAVLGTISLSDRHARRGLRNCPWLLLRSEGIALDPSKMSMDEIKALEQRLTDAGCYKGAIDGVASSAALDDAIRAGHILREDRQEILAIAAINYDIAP